MKHKYTDLFLKELGNRISASPAPTYVTILWAEFQKRLEKNERYSLRAFARDLDMDLGHLSRIFSGLRVPRLQTAIELATKLQLLETERKIFLDSIIPIKRKRRTQQMAAFIATNSDSVQ